MPTFSTPTTTLDLDLRSTWGAGLVADLSLTPTQSLDGWTVTFDYPGDIVNIWNARIVSQVGDRYVVEAMNYNTNVAAGGTVSFGFQGSGSVHEITPIALVGEPLDASGDPTPLPVVSVSDASASEADGEISFDLQLSEASTTDTTIAYRTVSGTAADGSDYTGANAEIVIPAGQTTATITLPVTDDATVEGSETFALELLSADGAEIGTGTATGTIYDNDTDTGDGGTGDGGDGDTGGSGPFIGGGQTYSVGQTSVVTGFDPTRDVLDLGPNSIHNQIPVDTPQGFMMLHMFNSSQSLLLEGVSLSDLHPENFAPIADAHLQQDLSAILAYEDGSGLVRPNTVYIRSHEEGLVETVDFNPATDKISFFYLSVRGDGQRNFAVEDTAEGARFYNPLTGQSLTLNGVSFSELDSSHFEWRANQLEDGIAGRMGLEAVIDNFSYVSENIFSGKSVAMAGGVDRAPYHSQQGYEEYTGTPIGDGSDNGGSDGDGSGDTGGDTGPIVVTVTGGSVTEADPGMDHMHDDGTSHMHDDGHRYITFTVSLESPAAEELTLTYTTADGTAVADTTSDVAWDYHTATGSLVFAVGEQTKTVAVAVHPDTLVEETETFTFSVSGDNITGTLEATGTIYDNDTDTGDGGTGDGGSGDTGGSGPFIGGGQTYSVGRPRS